jgi:hypothetical protein
MSIIAHPKYPDLAGVRSVRLLTGFRVHITFTDGVERELDLEPHLYGPIFEPLRRNPELFAAVFVDPIGQTLAWPNGADIAPETLYYEGDPPWAIDNQLHSRRTRRSASSQPRTRRKAPARAKRVTGR